MMEAAAVSASHGAMGSLLGKLGDLLADKYKLLKESKGEVMFLKAELESMQAFLKKMSDVEEPDEQAKCWAKEVRELSYDIEDSVDEFMLRVEHQSNCNSSGKPHGFKGFINRSIGLLTTINTRHKIAKEFQGLRGRVMDVSERRTRYKIDEVVSNKASNTAIDPRMLAIYVETAGLVGIERPRDELIQLMMDEKGMSSQPRKVLSIVGFGGLGKTTLANEIFRKLKDQFECPSFVSVSQKPNIKRILGNMLSQVGYVPPEPTNMVIWDEDKLIFTLREFLMDKRYFIVIDDIWNATIWNIIRCTLPENRNGSRVIVTTRIETVAIECCSNHDKFVYKMKPLGNNDSRKLFLKRIFGPRDDCPPHLQRVLTGILKRCGGLPLAIITISSLLSTQKNKLMKEQWERLLSSLGSNIEENPTLESMRRILSLSYINLPHYLKTCMLYLGIYPEDYTIDRNVVVKQWISQGFITEALGRHPEDVAENYFNELVNRSIIQPVDAYPDGEVLHCRVHDMMLDLIICKCREENFMTVVDDIQYINGQQDKVRRLSLYLDGAIDGKKLGTIQLSKVRALGRFGTSTYMPPLLEFKHLRSIILEFPTRDSTERIIDLNGICHLFQLRYIRILCNYIIELPRKISELKQLETLEIETGSGQLVVLPSDIACLTQLLHLIVSSGISLPEGIGNMKSLHTLRKADLGKNQDDTIENIGCLTNLRDLEICFSRETQLNDMAKRDRLQVFRSSLGKLCNLRYLCLGNHDLMFFCDELDSLSASPRLLRRLVTNDWDWFSRVPKWIEQCDNLYDLQVKVKEVLEDDIRMLSQLHSLIHLNLSIQGSPETKVVICATGFTALKQFFITCLRASYITFEAGAVPNLQMLWIRFNAQCWGMSCPGSAGIEHLSNLKEITFIVGGYGCKEFRRIKTEIRNAIGMLHPGCSAANICDDNSLFVFVGWQGQADDGFSWRKYGQKDILDAKYPRGYYRCTYRNTHGCRATKQVQRVDDDPLLFNIIYHGEHTCGACETASAGSSTGTRMPSSAPST